MKPKTIVRLGSVREQDSQLRVPALFITRPAQNEELLVSLNLLLDQVNQENKIFNRFVALWEGYARDSGYEFDYDKELYKKAGNTWQVIED